MLSMLPALLVVNRGQRRRDMAAVVKAAGTAVGAKPRGDWADGRPGSRRCRLDRRRRAPDVWPVADRSRSLVPVQRHTPGESQAFRLTRGIYCGARLAGGARGFRALGPSRRSGMQGRTGSVENTVPLAGDRGFASLLLCHPVCLSSRISHMWVRRRLIPLSQVGQYVV